MSRRCSQKSDQPGQTSPGRRSCTKCDGSVRATSVPGAGPTSINTEILTARIVALASEYGRYGYRRITAMLRQEGWQVNHKRVERIWRREGLKVPAKQPKADVDGSQMARS